MVTNAVSSLEEPIPDFGVDVQPSPDPGQLQSGSVSNDHRESPADASRYEQWATAGGLFWPSQRTTPELSPGVYAIRMQPDRGAILCLRNVVTDDLLSLPDDASASLVDEFATFWTRGDRFRARGLTHKRGFLLWGPPGSGKTSTIALMCQRLVCEHGGVVILADHPVMAAEGLAVLRQIEPDRPLVVILEDLDALIQKSGESQWLALLDGETQIDRVVFIATTNYPERLDKRFVNRPSRFDTIRYIGMPSAAARDVFFKHRAPELSSEERRQWVSQTEGFSVAHLRELVIAHYCFDQSVASVIKRLDGMRRKLASTVDPEAPNFGFLKGTGD